jgi:double-stranded uracil-DNA glycosylase
MGQTLPDLLFPAPRLVFIGTAAGAHSARVGAYYAKPGNKFWPTLHRIGLTPTLYKPHDFRALEALGIGLTDVCKTQSGQDSEIARAAFDVAGLNAKLKRFKPRAIAFTSKTGASLYLGAPTHKLEYGRQPATAEPIVFVLPSPSGLATSYWSEAPWRALADWFKAQK